MDFARYSCQIALPGFGNEKQQLLQNAAVLIVGAGGLGCPAAQYLASSGIGTLGIADFDTVSISNLHRQVLYNPADAGKSKATVACQRLQLHNPGIKIIPHLEKITSKNVMDILTGYDVVVDCTDNFDTRYLLNDAAIMLNIPVIYGAIYQFEGHAAVWNILNEKGNRSPNFRDIYPKVNASQIPDCADGGVMPALAGIIGCVQANEVIKLVTGAGELLAGKMFIIDVQTMSSRIIKIGDETQVSITSLVPTFETAINIHDFKIQLEQNTVDLIDVRTEQEHEQFNIGGINLPLDKLFDDLPKLNPNKETVIYCATGKRSAEAVKAIKQQYPGPAIYSLEGGLKKWLEDLATN